MSDLRGSCSGGKAGQDGLAVPREALAHEASWGAGVAGAGAVPSEREETGPGATRIPWSPRSRRPGAARSRGAMMSPRSYWGAPGSPGPPCPPLLTPTPGSQSTEPPKVLTAMGKMVQQIATINNLLIFINIQISRLQKPSAGRAREKARAGRRRLAPRKGWAARLLPVRGEGAPAPRPLVLLSATRVLGWLKRLHLLAWSGPGLPPPWAPGDQGSGLRSDRPAGRGPSPGAGQASRP